MAEVAGAVGGILTCLCAPNCLNTLVVDRCKYAKNHSKDIAELRKKKATLNAHKEDMSKRLDAAEVNEGKMRSRVVMNWLEDVNQVLDEANAIEEEVTKAKRGLTRLIPSCCSHSRMGSSISQLLKEAAELLQRYGGISSEPFAVLEGVMGKEYPVDKIIGKTTALKTVEKVWGCLMHDKVRTIGVYGMGGVGKTTIVTEINNRLIKQDHLFESVIWVSVSKSTSIRQIQACVAREIGLTLPDDEDERKISARLLGALKRRKKFLLILDDMWEEVSLLEMGIPEPSQENGCKILLTTRLLEVCRKMGCREQSTISVGLLSKNEAWELFIDRLGVELSEEKRKIAEELVEECALLPLAIITVGGAMREYSDITEWKLALNDLRDFGGQFINMEKRVFKCLKFSYDQLHDDMFKKCFLLCALYPEDWQIRTRQLIEYWVMAGLIEGRDDQDEFDKGKYILNKLKNHCLLVIVDHTEAVSEREKELSASVKMHDLIRDMALQFASVLVKDGVFLKKLPSEAEWREDLEGASFFNSDIRDVSLSPKCPKISILLLHSNRMLRSLSDCFFVQMQGLRVLDIGVNRKMQSLPNSISDLVNLRALLLNECSKLKCLPSLSKLQLLRILDLEGNRALESLPESISDLTELVELRLRKCYRLKRVPSVAKLHHLRSLKLGYTGITELPHGMSNLINLRLLEMEPLNRLKSRGGLVVGLLSMKGLEFLDIEFASVSECTDFVGSPNYMELKNFRIKIGSEPNVKYYELFPPGSNRSLEMYGPADGPYNTNFVPKNTEAFKIEGFNGIRSLNDFKCLTDARQVRACYVFNCKQLESIIKQKGECSLESMEQLTIQDCPQIHSVYDGIPSTTQHLKKLEIRFCHNLKNVFSSPRLLQQLQNLEELHIEWCAQVEEIIKSPTAEASNIITLPKLKTLRVVGLWKLKNIWSGEMVCNSLQHIFVIRCSAMKRLPIIRGEQQLPPPLLTKIGGEIEWWDSLEWEHPFAKNVFQPFFNRWY